MRWPPRAGGGARHRSRFCLATSFRRPPEACLEPVFPKSAPHASLFPPASLSPGRGKPPLDPPNAALLGNPGSLHGACFAGRKSERSRYPRLVCRVPGTYPRLAGPHDRPGDDVRPVGARFRKLGVPDRRARGVARLGAHARPAVRASDDRRARPAPGNARRSMNETKARTEFSSLVEVLRHRAAEQPNDPAYIFLPDRGAERLSLFFAELYAEARLVASSLAERGQKGDRAVLLFSPGLDFIVAFFACLLAGVIAVPLMVPRRASSRDASAAILADCSPRFAMTRRDLLTDARPELMDRLRTGQLEWVFVDSCSAGSGELQSQLPLPMREDIALLQYTSGSTSSPKGVIVSHANLIENSEMIRIALGNTRSSTHVSWVPLYHDMGLILNALQSLYVGALCVLLAPVSFMQRPLSWLRAIHDYRAEVAGGPNFAFDLCVRRHRPE